MATELAFAKSFLGLLDTKPSKISPDHVEDPRTYPGISPVSSLLPRSLSLYLALNFTTNISPLPI